MPEKLSYEDRRLTTADPFQFGPCIVKNLYLQFVSSNDKFQVNVKFFMIFFNIAVCRHFCHWFIRKSVFYIICLSLILSNFSTYPFGRMIIRVFVMVSIVFSPCRSTRSAGDVTAQSCGYQLRLSGMDAALPRRRIQNYRISSTHAQRGQFRLDRSR